MALTSKRTAPAQHAECIGNSWISFWHCTAAFKNIVEVFGFLCLNNKDPEVPWGELVCFL